MPADLNRNCRELSDDCSFIISTFYAVWDDVGCNTRESTLARQACQAFRRLPFSGWVWILCRPKITNISISSKRVSGGSPECARSLPHYSIRCCRLTTERSLTRGVVPEEILSGSRATRDEVQLPGLI